MSVNREMKKKANAFCALSLAVACSSAAWAGGRMSYSAFCGDHSYAGVEVERVFRPERLTRGDTNVKVLQPVDEAAWVWAKDDPCWSFDADDAWNASPVAFCQTAFAGVRPASPFFKTVRIAPDPAGLKRIRATTPSPCGPIETALEFADGGVSGAVTLPKGLSGEFVWNGRTQSLSEGRNEIRRK